MRSQMRESWVEDDLILGFRSAFDAATPFIRRGIGQPVGRGHESHSGGHRIRPVSLQGTDIERDLAMCMRAVDKSGWMRTV